MPALADLKTEEGQDDIGDPVAEGSEDVLAPGMLISVEPGIYLPGVGCVRHSDSVLITEDGHVCLTWFPTDQA